MKQIFKPMRITLTVLLMGVILLFSQESNAQGSDYGDLTYNKAINVSGKQRMLGQKLAKAYVYLSTNPDDAKAKRDLMVSKLVFEKQNKILANNTESELTKAKLEEVEDLWREYKKLLEGTPNTKNAKKVIEKNSELLIASNAVVGAIIAESEGAILDEASLLDTEGMQEDDTSLKNIINIAGRQRMLSQRLALYYFANTEELQDKNTMATLKQVVYALDDAIGTLLISEFNTSRIDEKLVVAMTKWESIKDNVTALYAQEIPAKEIYATSDALTKAFNDVTTLYEKVKI